MKNNPKSNIRHVKLYGKWCAPKDVLRYKGKIVPWLNVSGVWLEQAGFSIGDNINIEVGRKRLTITRQAEEH